MTKFEIVITAWDDNMFKGRKRIESDDPTEAANIAQYTMENILDEIQKEKEKWASMKDDDIPF